MVCRFWGFVNMPTFIDLRADYPLILTLLAPAYTCALTWFYIARRISPHAIAIPLIRHNQPVPVKISTNFRSNFSSSACAPSASESPWGLTLARASFREFQLHSAEQLKSAVERKCANFRGSTEFDFPQIGNVFSGQISGIRRQERTSVLAALGGMPVRGQVGTSQIK